MMKKMIKLLIVATLFVSPSFADCYDALHKQAEDIKEIRWKAYFEEGSTADLDEKSCQAVDHVSLKTSTLSDEYAKGKERIEVLKILWQRWDVIQYGLGYDNLNFNRSDADPRRQGHFCALHVMMQGITALYNDPTLGVEDGVFFKHMADYGRTADQALKNYYTDKALKTLFPKGFFLDVFKCGAMEEDHSKKVYLATMFRGENFTAKGPDFFAIERQTTTYTFERFPKTELIGRVVVKSMIDQKSDWDDFFYIKSEDCPAYSRFYEVYGQHHKDMLYKEPVASLEDALMHAFDETYDKPFTTKVTYGGNFKTRGCTTYYYPFSWALGEGFQNLASYLEFLLFSEHWENLVPRQFDLEKLCIFFNEKKSELGNSIHADWKRLMDDFERTYKAMGAMDAPAGFDQPRSDDFSEQDADLPDRNFEPEKQDSVSINPLDYISSEFQRAYENLESRLLNDLGRALKDIGFEDVINDIMSIRRPKNPEQLKEYLTEFLNENFEKGLVPCMVDASFKNYEAWTALTKNQQVVFKTTLFRPIRNVLMGHLDDIYQWIWNNSAPKGY